ncbi:tol-pal system-associated acyl-CoA thioesterase [Legionella antarctica]|uniref:Tol-pal system-associated acyl-CoA thioesterase n=1 Tax=Legionella antarctica TaxID=2708020 RepID=A0A6F8T495_9GAMM|nr:tol-pal system-associated acyl-CoA thioesterase [Legionella antarctica]BCA95505.1 tol-pal system-associated acyl-CoA thioesterase [Legionella antarctica]
MSEATTDQHTVRVYAEDVDFMGIVYHANYLCYFERARTELLRKNNWTLSNLINQNILFAIKELTLKYIHPAKLDDFLTVTTRIKDLRACSFLFDQKMVNQHGILICEAEVKVVCVNSDLKPQRLPNQN